MGIFDFLKKKNNDSFNVENRVVNAINKEFTFKELNVDLFFQNPKIINEELFDNGLKKVVHLVDLNHSLFGLFHTAEVTYGLSNNDYIMCDNGEKRIANISFKAHEFEISRVKEITNELMTIFMINDDPWSEVDEMRIRQGSWRGRSGPKLKFCISTSPKGEIELQILGFNDFLKTVNQ
jgi:hypothetical protein